MCGPYHRRAARQAPPDSGSGCCCCCCCCRAPMDGCGCPQASVPSATISMADYESFLLVPTSVFDQGDVDCGCSEAW